MPHLAVIQLMRVIKWLRSDSDGSCVKINMRGNKGFYSILLILCTIFTLKQNFQISLREIDNSFFDTVNQTSGFHSVFQEVGGVS